MKMTLALAVVWVVVMLWFAALPGVRSNAAPACTPTPTRHPHPTCTPGPNAVVLSGFTAR
jgi:hypothetical protein